MRSPLSGGIELRGTESVPRGGSRTEPPTAVADFEISEKVFHSPHSGHRPDHLGSSWLQWEQINTVFGFAIYRIILPDSGGNFNSLIREIICSIVYFDAGI
jgi:hypothetical protein